METYENLKPEVTVQFVAAYYEKLTVDILVYEPFPFSRKLKPQNYNPYRTLVMPIACFLNDESYWEKYIEAYLSPSMCFEAPAEALAETGIYPYSVSVSDDVFLQVVKCKLDSVRFERLQKIVQPAFDGDKYTKKDFETILNKRGNNFGSKLRRNKKLLFAVLYDNWKQSKNE